MRTQRVCASCVVLVALVGAADSAEHQKQSLSSRKVDGEDLQEVSLRALPLRAETPPALNDEPKLQPSATYHDRSLVRVRAIADLWPGGKGSYPGRMVVYRDAVHFRGMHPGYGEALWRFDGRSVELAARLSPNKRRTYAQLLAVHNDKLYLSVVPEQTSDRKERPWMDLWEYDGQTARPVPAARTTQEPDAVEFRGKLYYTGYDEAFGQELWSFDGQTASRVADVNAGPRDSRCHRLVVFQDALYFFADDGLRGVELWKFDGREATLVADIDGEPSSSRMNVYDAAVVFKDKLYFGADDGKTGKELWCWDGKRAKLAADVNPGPLPSFSSGLVVHGGRLYFSANHLFRPETVIAYRPALWSFDGDNASLVADSGGDGRWQGVGAMGSWNELLAFGVSGESQDARTFVLDGKVVSPVRTEPPADALLDANLVVQWKGRAFGIADLPGKGYEPCEFVLQSNLKEDGSSGGSEKR